MTSSGCRRRCCARCSRAGRAHLPVHRRGRARRQRRRGDAVEPRGDGRAFTFLAQLFYRGADEPFDAARIDAPCTARWASIGSGCASPSPRRPRRLAALRLDPTNRPGYLRLYGMSLFAAGGELPVEVGRDQGARQGQAATSCTSCATTRPTRSSPSAPATIRGSSCRCGPSSWRRSRRRHARGRAVVAAVGRLAPRDRDAFSGSTSSRGASPSSRASTPTCARTSARSASRSRSCRASCARRARRCREIDQSLTFRIARPLHAIVNRLRGS